MCAIVEKNGENTNMKKRIKIGQKVGIKDGLGTVVGKYITAMGLTIWVILPQKTNKLRKYLTSEIIT